MRGTPLGAKHADRLYALRFGISVCQYAFGYDLTLRVLRPEAPVSEVQRGLGFSLHCFGFELLGPWLMRKIAIILLTLGPLALAGCASYEGAATDEYNHGYGAAMNPASPTFRPGMYPQDPRDRKSVV